MDGITPTPTFAAGASAAAPASPSLGGLIGFPAEAYEQEVVIQRALGRTRLILNKPDAIRHVLVDNAANYGRTAATSRLLYPVVGAGLFLADGDDWREQRRSLAPAFAPRTMPALAAHVAAVTEARVALLAAESAGGAAVNLLDHIHSLAIEIAGRSMFSLDMAPYVDRMRALLRTYSLDLGRPTILDIRLPPAIPTWRDLRRRGFRRRWMRLIDEIIAARQHQAAPGRDLLDLMAGETSSGAAAMTPQLLADQVATMISAGHATTAIALFWSCYLVASHPEVQTRIAAEAGGVDLSVAGAAQAMPQLVYTRAAMQEALRLYPPAFLIVRRAYAADDAAGVKIPRSGVAMIAPWLLHRHRLLWRDPDRFDPDRFMPGAPAPDRFAYLPFGAGPRVCIGAQFALTEATLALAGLLRRFQITLAEERPAVPVAAITLQPAHPPPLFRLTPW